jgi:hypothetical protein
MTARRLGFWPAPVAALVAVALLSFASVQSVVMQVAAAGPAGPWPICSVASPGKGAPQTPSRKADSVCGFCAAAGEAPVLSLAAPLPTPVAVIWTPPPAVPALGPRGPPRLRPKARDPPSAPRTV